MLGEWWVTDTSRANFRSGILHYFSTKKKYTKKNTYKCPKKVIKLLIMKNKFFVLAIIFSPPYKSLFLACKAVSMVYKQGENYRGYLKEGGNSGHWGEGGM